MKMIFIGLMGICAVLLGSGAPEAIAAQEGSAPKQAVPAATAQQPAQAVTSAPTAAPAMIQYTGADRRDPFVPLISRRGDEKSGGVSPLLAYDVIELKLIAILWDKTKYYAVVSLPDGKSYTLSNGAYVGLHSGVVKAISKDTVVITEKVRDSRGAYGSRDHVLRLRGEDE